MIPEDHNQAAEVVEGRRFEFCENWSNCLRVPDQKRIDEAISSLQKTLRVSELNGKGFLDVDCSSGLF